MNFSDFIIFVCGSTVSSLLIGEERNSKRQASLNRAWDNLASDVRFVNLRRSWKEAPLAFWHTLMRKCRLVSLFQRKECLLVLIRLRDITEKHLVQAGIKQQNDLRTKRVFISPNVTLMRKFYVTVLNLSDLDKCEWRKREFKIEMERF